MVRWYVCLSTHWEGYWRRIKWYSQHVMWHHCHQLAHRPNNCWFLSVSRSSGTLCDPLLVKFFIHLALCCASINLWLYQPMLFSPLYFCISFSYSLAKYHCHQDQEILSSWLMAQSILLEGWQWCQELWGSWKWWQELWGGWQWLHTLWQGWQSSCSSLAPSIMAELFPAEESRIWTVATEALPPITVSNSVKNQIKCIGVLFIWFAFSSTFS